MTIRQQRTGEQLRAEIIRALRHGALNHYQVAADVVASPATVRDHLRGQLSRERVVRRLYTARGIEWQLTDRGAARAWAGDQTKLEDRP